MWRTFLLICLLSTSASAVPHLYYATASGSGSSCSDLPIVAGRPVGTPCAIRDLIDGTVPVTAGSTIYLLGASAGVPTTYTGKFNITISGTVGNQIVLRNYPGDIIIIDGYQTTTLNGAVDSSTTTVVLTSGTNFNAGDVIVVGLEHIQLGVKSGSTYTGCIRAWNGTTAASHSSGTLTILGGNIVTMTGDHLRVIGTKLGLTITDSDPVRTQASTNTQNSANLRGITVYQLGDDVDVINCVLMQGESGIFASQSAVGRINYGNLIMYNGGVHTYPTDPHFGGHGLYQQNVAGTALIRHNAILFNFNFGAQLESQTGDAVGFRVQGNIFAGAGSLSNSSGKFNLLLGANDGIADNDQVTDNYFYTPTSLQNVVKLGYAGVNGSLVATGNYIGGGGQALELIDWGTLTATTNTSVIQSNLGPGNTVLLNYAQTGTPTVTLNNNTYINLSGNTTPFTSTFNNGLFTFAQWKSDSGYDATSTYSTSTPADKIAIIPNEYETGRCWVIIYNWAASNSVSANLSTCGLSNGQAYTAYQVQNYFTGAPISGTYNSSAPSVSFDMRTSTWGTTGDVPAGWSWPFAAPSTMLPTFGVFLVIPSQAGAASGVSGAVTLSGNAKMN